MTWDNIPRPDKGPDPYVTKESRLKIPKRLEIHAPIRTTEAPDREVASVGGNYSIDTQSINDSTWTTVTWGQKFFDPKGLFATDHYSIPIGGRTTGLWLMETFVKWAANATGLRKVAFYSPSDSTRYPGWIEQPGLSGTLVQSMELSHMLFDPKPGQTFAVQVWQNSGGALNIIKGNDIPPEIYGIFNIAHLW